MLTSFTIGDFSSAGGPGSSAPAGRRYRSVARAAPREGCLIAPYSCTAGPVCGGRASQRPSLALTPGQRRRLDRLLQVNSAKCRAPTFEPEAYGAQVRYTSRR
jgi:hypothetical protein